MAIVRLVTESIPNHKNRDEEQNKVLVSRLVEAIKKQNIDLGS